MTFLHFFKNNIFFFFLLFWPYPEACWTLVPQPGIEPARPASEKWNFNHWITTEVPAFLH